MKNNCLDIFYWLLSFRKCLTVPSIKPTLPKQVFMGHGLYRCGHEENSLSLFRYLIEDLKFQMVECDVRFTENGVPVLSHAQLVQDKAYATLEDLLMYVQDKDVWVMLDLAHEKISMLKAWRIIRLLKKYGMIHRCILADGGVLKFAIFDQNLTFQLQGVLSDSMVNKAKKKLSVCANMIISQSLWMLCDHMDETQSLGSVEFAHRDGLLTKVAVVNDAEVANRFLALGVDLIMTDELVNE